MDLRNIFWKFQASFREFLDRLEENFRKKILERLFNIPPQFSQHFFTTDIQSKLHHNVCKASSRKMLHEIGRVKSPPCNRDVKKNCSY